MKQLKFITRSLNDFQKILLVFVSWRVLLFVVAFFAAIFIPRWGGWFPYSDQSLAITGLPNWIWEFGNFDGVHYLRIAQNGYGYLGSQAFFPLFPLLIRYVSYIFPKIPGLDTQVYVDPSFFYAGIIISNIAMVFALYYLYKWIKLEFDSKTVFLSVIFLLFFPTSFYLGAVYTESIFIFLGAATLFYLRSRNYLAAGIFASLASVTKVVGICLALLLLVEFIAGYLQSHKIDIKQVIGVLIAPLGLVGYIYYLFRTFGNPLNFISSQPLFGQNRSAEPFITLPQVIYRYLKIFLATPILTDKFFGATLEIVFTLGALTVLVLLTKKMRFSYWLATLGMLIIPTMTGTFNSMPRYVLTGFMMIPFVITAMKKKVVYLYPFFVVLGIILLSLFIRGYWVA